MTPAWEPTDKVGCRDRDSPFVLSDMERAARGRQQSEGAAIDTPEGPSASSPPADYRLEFEGFFAASFGPLVGQAYVLTGDLQEAQDLAQETLAQAWRHWSRIRDYDNPSAWARRVLHNLAVSRWRRARLRRRHEPNGPLSVLAPPGEAHVDLLAALRRLPERQRRAVVLHDVVGLTAEEIGTEMGAAPSTVRTWVHRGRRRLEEEVGRDE